MVFSSTIFVFFFLPLSLAVYTLAPKTLKNLILLVSSFLFYAWGEGYLVLLLILSTAFNHVFAGILEKYRKPGIARKLLLAGVLINLSVLFFYKYAVFFLGSLASLPGFSDKLNLTDVEVYLPIGISFYTFQSISYLVDVYRGTVSAQRRYVNTALYIALFPQLIAGPVVRYHDIAAQLSDRQIDSRIFSEGIRRFIKGLAKKVIIANPMGFVADQIFSLPADELSWQLAWIGAVSYALQIYFDFSGYSDMAIGLGRMFGFRFPENFNYPYISRSIREFWRRWHISLSSWFRDYLYIPLGGSQGTIARTCFNLTLVFVLCGLWHGASWSFALWGLYHGLFLMLERIGLDRLLQNLWTPVQHCYALLVVCFGWILFRAENPDYAVDFWFALLGFNTAVGSNFSPAYYLNSEVAVVLCAALMLSFGWHKWILDVVNTSSATVRLAGTACSQRRYWIESIYLLGVFALTLTYLARGTYNPFIYFRF